MKIYIFSTWLILPRRASFLDLLVDYSCGVFHEDLYFQYLVDFAPACPGGLGPTLAPNWTASNPRFPQNTIIIVLRIFFRLRRMFQHLLTYSYQGLEYSQGCICCG